MQHCPSGVYFKVWAFRSSCMAIYLFATLLPVALYVTATRRSGKVWGLFLLSRTIYFFLKEIMSSSINSFPPSPGLIWSWSKLVLSLAFACPAKCRLKAVHCWLHNKGHCSIKEGKRFLFVLLQNQLLWSVYCASELNYCFLSLPWLGVNK